MNGLARVLAAAVAMFIAAPAGAAIVGQTAGQVAPPLYKNCTNLNKRYPHGVGKRLARDRTSDEPVRNFRRSTAVYNLAMSYNRGLDRDKDGIACEQS